MGTNQFLPFSPTDTGTNLLSQADYAAAADRTIGNQPGVASSQLVNKSIRQPTFVVSQIAQYLADSLGVNVLDDANATKLLAQITASENRLSPIITKYITGTGTHYKTYKFFIAVGSATAGATYTNNTFTFTVSTTVASGLVLTAVGTGAPEAFGTLTKSGGTGDTTITFYAMRAPLYFQVKMAGAGGGGAGSSTAVAANGNSGTAGGDTTFGLSTAGGGALAAGNSAGSTVAGGTATLGTGMTGLALNGSRGGGSSNTGVAIAMPGGEGGDTPYLNGAGKSGGNTNAINAVANSGGGGGGGSAAGGAAFITGGGGGSGSFIDGMIAAPAASYPYAVGAKGTKGTAGSSGLDGSDGADGIIEVIEHYQ